jgi:acyl-coenzyme A thioesterase PaaI-like protein
MIARAHLLRIGKNLCVGRVDLFDAKRKLVAAAIVTYILLGQG